MPRASGRPVEVPTPPEVEIQAVRLWVDGQPLDALMLLADNGYSPRARSDWIRRFHPELCRQTKGAILSWARASGH